MTDAAMKAVMEMLGVDTPELALDRITFLVEEATRDKPCACKATKEALPWERDSKVHKVRIYDGKEVYSLYIIIGLYEDGRPGEVFCTLGKHGGTIGGLLSALSITISMGLQHGIPVEKVCRKLRGMRFAPMGRTKPPMGDVSSVVDVLARVLLRYAPAEEVAEAEGDET